MDRNCKAWKDEGERKGEDSEHRSWVEPLDKH